MHARSGLSLLEVLFSMGILLVGLMGVAAMIPAGRHEILEGSKIDHAGAIGRAAVRDIKIREFHEPSQWRDSGGNPVYQNGAYVSTGGFVALDPLGLESGFGAKFPAAAGATFLTRVYPCPQPANPADRLSLAGSVFRDSDELTLTPNPLLRDGPPIGAWWYNYGSRVGTRAAPIPMADWPNTAGRVSQGNYSWIATITPENPTLPLRDPSTVSVAVYYKRDLAAPSVSEPVPLQVTFTSLSYSPTGSPSAGQQLLVFNPLTPIKPGSWVMLAGEITVPVPMGVYARWFRVLAADKIRPGANTQAITLAGSDDWNVLPPSGNSAANQTQLWRFENVIAVFERIMTLDLK